MSSEEDPWSGIPEEVKAGSEAPVPQVSSVHKMEELQEKIRETQQTYGRKVHKLMIKEDVYITQNGCFLYCYIGTC